VIKHNIIVLPKSTELEENRDEQAEFVKCSQLQSICGLPHHKGQQPHNSKLF
jgi:hypothetical protein